MRTIPQTFDPAVVAEIDRRLDRVERDHRVTIPWCIESGSRAWGFPSPDSDYDSRFVFVRSENDYLSPWLPRDVIETPLDEIFDVNGWDLRKAVQLLVKGNAVVVEWLRSPFVYRGDESFRSELLALADAVADRQAIGRHYTHVCLGQWERHGGADEMPLKRLFYALRPAASIRWLAEHPDSATPPMEMGQLLEQTSTPSDVAELVDELIVLKSRTRELGTGTVPPALATYVVESLALGTATFGSAGATRDGEHRALAAESFRHLVRSYGPGSGR